jgi:hypothetical protein
VIDLIKNALRPFYELFTSREVDISSIYTRATPRDQRIPNVVHQTWTRPALPLRHAQKVVQFRELNEDYSFIFYNDAQIEEYMQQNFSGHPILAVFKDLLIPASKIDVWRYCLLYNEGGIYCDIDSALTIPFRELLAGNPPELISFEGNTWKARLDLTTCADPRVFLPCPPRAAEQNLEHADHLVLNWLLCFEKGNPILAEVIDLIVRHADFYRGRAFGGFMVPILHFTGPLALTQAVWMHIAKTNSHPQQFGIDFSGYGIFKIPGERFRFASSPHYSTLPGGFLIKDRAG